MMEVLPGQRARVLRRRRRPVGPGRRQDDDWHASQNAPRTVDLVGCGVEQGVQFGDLGRPEARPRAEVAGPRSGQAGTGQALGLRGDRRLVPHHLQAARGLASKRLQRSRAGTEQGGEPLRLMLDRGVDEDDPGDLAPAAGREEPRIEPARRMTDQHIGARDLRRLQAPVQVAGDRRPVARHRPGIRPAVTRSIVGADPRHRRDPRLGLSPSERPGAKSGLQDHGRRA